LKKFTQQPVKIVKQTLIDFYDSESIHTAKQLLMQYVEALLLPNWTKPPTRRKDSKDHPGNKIRNDVDDIIGMFIVVDENKRLSSLPTFVAADPDLLPSTKLTEGDMQCVLQKISGLSEQIYQMDTNLHESCHITSASIGNAIHESLTKRKLFENIDSVKTNLNKICEIIELGNESESASHPRILGAAEKSSALSARGAINTGSKCTSSTGSLHEDSVAEERDNLFTTVNHS